MKRIICLVAAAIAAGSTSAAAVERLLVRQQWPWSSGIKVEYALSGLSGAVDLGIKVYLDEVLVENIPSQAFAGDVYNVEKNIGSFTIDPTLIWGTSKVVSDNLRVELTLSDSADKMNEAIYKIFDLDTGACTDVTRADILNGKYGAYETDYGKIGTGFTTTLSDVLIWTGVTNDIAYKTSKLVMRKINAKDKVWQSGDVSGAEVTSAMPARTQYWNKLTYDYYIAVFETTIAQYAKINGSATDCARPAGDTEGISAANNMTYKTLVGQSDWQYGIVTPAELICFPTNKYVRDVSDNSVVGKLWTKTKAAGKCYEFTLPTIAEWEYACMGGNTSVLYSGLPSGLEVNKTQLGWVKSNADGEVHRVGEKPCNAYGLYDTLGNIMERVLGTGELNEGAESGDGLTEATPAVNPLGMLNTVVKTNPMYCGGCWGGSSSEEIAGYCSNKSLRHAARHGTYIEYNANRTYMGFRLAMPARDDGQWADHPSK